MKGQGSKTCHLVCRFCSPLTQVKLTEESVGGEGGGAGKVQRYYWVQRMKFIGQFHGWNSHSSKFIVFTLWHGAGT